MDTITTTRRFVTADILLAVSLVVLVALGGCASKPDDAATAEHRPDTNALAACLRDRGYDVDDTAMASGLAQLPEGAEPDQYLADLGDCSRAAGGSGPAEAEELPGAEDRRREVAACVRDGGYPEYPDDLDGQAAFRASDDVFEDVRAACTQQAFGGEVIGG